MTAAPNTGFLRAELALWVGALTAVLFLLFGDAWLADLSSPIRYGFFFAWLFVSMLWLAFARRLSRAQSDRVMARVDKKPRSRPHLTPRSPLRYYAAVLA